jgi:hypothetical protein
MPRAYERLSLLSKRSHKSGRTFKFGQLGLPDFSDMAMNSRVDLFRGCVLNPGDRYLQASRFPRFF